MDSTPRASRFNVDLEDYLLTEKELQQYFVPPKGYALSQASLRQHRQLWLIGPPGIGKRSAALALANDLQIQKPTRRVFLIPRSVPWSQFAKLTQRTGDESVIQLVRRLRFHVEQKATATLGYDDLEVDAIHDQFRFSSP